MIAMIHRRGNLIRKGFGSRTNPRESKDTQRTENKLQKRFLELYKSKLISKEIYEFIRPIGSQRPRMYGLSKIHKPGIPRQPILSMYWLSYSSHTSHHPSQIPCLPWISYATQKLMFNSCKMVEKQSEAFHTFLWHFFQV